MTISASPFADRSQIDTALPRRTAPGASGTGRTDRSGRCDVGSERLEQLVRIVGGEVDLVCTSLHREGDLFTFAVLEDRTIEIVYKVGHVLSCHARILPRTGHPEWEAELVTELAPDEYSTTLSELKAQVHRARLKVQRAANNELLQVWWRIGDTIRRRQAEQGWGTQVITRLAEDLRAEFPAMKGFSRANLFYMRRFAQAWPDLDAVVQRPVGQLPWGHVIELLDKIDNTDLRDWYAAKDAHHGWSRSVLAHQITTRLHEREAAAPSNFAGALEQRDSDQAQELTKDPYALQFLAIDSNVSERELEQRLVDRILETMRELGPGFAFVGRQVHLDVDGDDYYIDLLFFHVEQLRYVVIELKTTMFDPRDAGQLGFYVAVVDDRLRIPEKHQPTVGILLVAGKNDTVVRYALASTAQPVAVSRHELNEEAQKALPDETAIARAFADELGRAGEPPGLGE